MNLTDALKFVEEHVPGTLAHKLESAQQLLEQHKAELTRAVGELESVVSTSSTLAAKQSQLESYLEGLKSTIITVEADIDKLSGTVKAQPSNPGNQSPNAPVAPATPAKAGGVTVTQTSA